MSKKNKIIEEVMELININNPKAKKNQVVISKNGTRIPVDMIETQRISMFRVNATIYSVWYVGGELPHILPLYNEHVALGVLLEKGYVNPKINCVFIVDNEEEKQTWENWYKQLNTKFEYIEYDYIRKNNGIASTPYDVFFTTHCNLLGRT